MKTFLELIDFRHRLLCSNELKSNLQPGRVWLIRSEATSSFWQSVWLPETDFDKRGQAQWRNLIMHRVVLLGKLAALIYCPLKVSKILYGRNFHWLRKYYRFFTKISWEQKIELRLIIFLLPPRNHFSGLESTPVFHQIGSSVIRLKNGISITMERFFRG